MMRNALFILLIFLCGPAQAEILVAARTIPARAIIGPDDVLIREASVPGAASDPSIIVGQEARVALYAGRPIHPGDVGPPAVVERNQIVPLIYQTGHITISTEGRALDRAGPGDFIRVMNLSSRMTVTARINQDGSAMTSIQE